MVSQSLNLIQSINQELRPKSCSPRVPSIREKDMKPLTYALATRALQLRRRSHPAYDLGLDVMWILSPILRVIPRRDI